MYSNSKKTFDNSSGNTVMVQQHVLSRMIDGHKQQKRKMFTSSFIKLFDKWKNLRCKDCCGWNMNCWTSISNMSIETNGRCFALWHFKERERVSGIVHSLQTNQTLFSSSLLLFMSAQIPKTGSKEYKELLLDERVRRTIIVKLFSLKEKNVSGCVTAIATKRLLDFNIMLWTGSSE